MFKNSMTTYPKYYTITIGTYNNIFLSEKLKTNQ